MPTKDPKYKRQDRSKYFSKGDLPEITAAEKNFAEWYSEPATRRRFPGTEEELDKGVQKALDTKAFASFDVPNRGDAVYYKGAPQYGVEPQIRLENTSGDVFEHELVHATQFDDQLGEQLQGILGKKAEGYYGQPGELYGNFHQIRSKMGLQPWERSFTPEKVLELIKFNGLEEDEDVKTFLENWGPEKFSEALNTIASTEADQRRLDRLNFAPSDNVIMRPTSTYA